MVLVQHNATHFQVRRKDKKGDGTRQTSVKKDMQPWDDGVRAYAAQSI